MAWRRLNVCVGLLLLLLAEPPKAKGDAAPTFQPATLPTSTHTPEIDEEFYASTGHVMVLPCDDAEGQNVTWRREKAPPLGVDGGGVRVMDGALWFLPANSSHSGVYVCEWSDGVQRVMLRVDSGVCPEKTRDRYLDLSADVGRLNCKQDHIFKSDPQAHITWLKDCEPLNSFERTLHIFNVSRQDGGRYTCLLHFSLEGQNYTSASTTEVHIDGSELPSKPQVIGPRNETLVVELGSRVELRCEATTGNEHTILSWKMNGSTIHSSPPFTISPSSPSHSDKTQVPRVAKTLVISEVGVEHLNVPFQCRATNALGRDVGQILLKTANHEMFYCVVGMAVFCGLLLVCVYLCWRRRVDLVLLYRSLCPALHKHCDGKLYDAYVSYPSGNSVSMAMTFALRVLPEVLERNYGYKLFIRGRDDLPGEAVFDIIDEALAKSRRLIIVLDGTPMETHTLNVHAEIIPLTFTHTHGETHAQSHTHKQTDTQSDTHTDTNTLTHTHIDTYTQSDTHTHTNTLTHQEKIPLTFTHTPSKTHTWSDTHKGTPTESVTHSDTHPDTHTQSDTLTDTHTQSDTHTDTHTQSDTLTDTLTDTHTQSDTHTDTKTQCDTDTDTHTHRDTHTDTHTQWDPDTHTQCDPEQVCFERTLGQYDALVSSGLKVLIVQTGEEGSTLPPPLLLLTRSKRPLRWHTHTHSHTHSHSHSHTPSQQRFWKELRYRMPAPQKTIHQNSSAV